MEWTRLDWKDEATHPALDKFVLVCCVDSNLDVQYFVAKMQEIPEDHRVSDDDWVRYFADIDGDYFEWLSDRDQHFRVLWAPITDPVVG